MATGTEGKAMVFKLGSGNRGGGGGGGYSGGMTDPFGYALKREALGYERAAQDRAEQSFEIAKRKEELQTRREERLQNRELRAMEDQDQIDSALDKISTVLGRPDSMKFGKNYETLMGDPEIHRARTSKAGRDAIDSMMLGYQEKHNDYTNSWKAMADGYGWQGDISKFAGADGTIDWKKAQPEFDSALQRKNAYIASQQAREQAAAQKAGYDIISMTDESGKTTRKLQKSNLMPWQSNSPVAKSEEAASNRLQNNEGQDTTSGEPADLNSINFGL